MPWEDDVPAWSGVVGKTLQDAALGFSQALLDMPKERRAAEKEQLDIDRIRSQIKLDEANAAKALKYGEDDLFKTGWGAFRRKKDPVTGETTLELLSAKPSAADKPLLPENQRREGILQSMENFWGIKRHEWGQHPEIILSPKYAEFMDAYHGRSDVILGPDGMPLSRRQVRRDANGQPIPEPPVPGEKPAAGEKPPAPTKPVTAPADLRPGLQKIADTTGARLEDLERVISFETGGTFSADARNPRSGATGYIQFTPGTAERMGTTTDAIAKMTPEQQLALVERYLMPYKGRIGNLQDLYLAIFAPAAIGKGGNEVLYSQKDHPKAYEQNRALDKDNKGYITAADATAAVMRHGAPAGIQVGTQKPQAPEASAVPTIAKPPPGTPTTPLAAIPSTVEWQLEQWQKKPPEVADQEIATWLKAPATGISVPDLLSRVEAYRKLRGTDPPGWSEHPVAKRLAAGQGQPAQPAQPTGPSQPGGSPASTAGQPPAPQAQSGVAPTATGQPGPGQIPVQQYRTPAQIQKDEAAAEARGRAGSKEDRDQDEHAWKYWQAQLNWSAEQRAEWYQQRLARLDKTQHPTVEQAAVANDLWTSGQVRPETMGFYPDLDPYEKKKVNDVIKDPVLKEEARKQGDFMRRQSAENRADRREHLEAMGKVQPFFQEIGALDTAQYLTTQIIDLIEKGNVGLWGKVSGYEQAIGNIVGYRQNQFLTQIDAQLKASGINPNIDTTARKLALTNAIETTDPKIRQQYRMISPQSRVQTLSSLLIYAHAMAAKRVAGGTERGLIGTDMAHAEKLFDPSLWYANPGQLLANLQELQGFIHQARPKLDEMITAHHINPKTKLLIKRDYEDKPGAVPATQVPTAPQVAPQVEQQNMQILQGG